MYQEIPISNLRESPTNPRKFFNAQKLAELTQSVESSGIVQPLIVRARDGFHEIVCGARRYRAATAAGLAVIPVIVRELDDAEVLQIQLIENLQRDDAHYMEEAAGFQQLMELGNYSHEQIAAKVGKDESTIRKRVMLNRLIPELQDAAYEGMPLGHAEMLARFTPDVQREAAANFQRSDDGDEDDEGWPSLRDMRYWIEQNCLMALTRAPWGLEDGELVAAAGSCMACPKRTGAAGTLFADISKTDCCTDPTCWQTKHSAFLGAAREALRQKNPEFLEISEFYSAGASGGLPGVIYSQYYHEVSKGSCEHIVTGLVVHGSKIGSTKRICAAKGSCKVHWGRGDKSEAGVAASEKGKATKLERAARGQVLREVLAQAAAVKELPLEAWRLIARELHKHLNHDAMRSLYQTMGWTPGKAEWGENFRSLPEEAVATPATVRRTLAAMAMIGSVTPSEYMEREGSEPAVLAMAELFGVDPDAAREAAAPKPKAAKVPKGDPDAAREAAAPKPKAAKVPKGRAAKAAASEAGKGEAKPRAGRKGKGKPAAKQTAAGKRRKASKR